MKHDLLIKFCLSFGIALCSLTTVAQSLDKSVQIYFRIHSSVYEPGYNGNSSRLKAFSDSLVTFLQRGNYKISTADFHAGGSPEGPVSLNKRLTEERLENSITAFLEVIGEDIDFHSDSLWRLSAQIGRWDEVAHILEPAQEYSKEDSLRMNSVLEVLHDNGLSDREKSRILRSMDGGKVWNNLAENAFPKLRISRITLRLTPVEKTPAIIAEAPPVVSAVATPAPDIIPYRVVRSQSETIAKEQLPQNEWHRKIRVGTNALGLALLIGNISGEVDITENLSFYLPVYYSGLDYFTPTIKFRTFAIQPELRWNFSRPEGLFAGVHFGLAYFNLATDGNWRIQTHKGNEPLIGGGLSIGYRLPLDKNKRWNVDFVLGAGAYRFHYDKFYNEPNGAFAGSVEKVYLGVDNAAVSFSYSFDLGRGRRK